MTWICSHCRTRFEERRTRCPHDGRRVVQDLAGEVVGGRYTLRELLGVGGMDSSVWLAWQQSIQRAVAIKLLPPADDPSTERFARGARIASNLSHPNITVVHDYGTTDDGHLYLVMELLDGQTLHRVLRRTHLPPARVIHIIDQVLRALDHAHRRNIVHRDIKPGNLYLINQSDGGDFIKVLDFGIARYIDSADDPVDKQEITMERQICGTPQYMAPEQVAFGQVDARTDIYALGVVMYRMLTGRLPFQSGSHHELFRMHLHTAPPPFREVKADLGCPPALEAVVMRALAKSPDERFASAAEMRMALRQVRNQMGLPAEPDEPSMPSSSHGWSLEPPRPATTPRRGNGFLYAALVILALAVVALAVIRREPEPVVTTPPAESASARAAQPPATPPAIPTPRPDAAVAARAPVVPDAAAAAPPAAPDAAVAEQDDEPDAGGGDGPVYHRVSIFSDPPGAQVTWQGRPIGQTPLHTRLVSGRHQLRIRLDGHEPETWNLALTGEESRRVARSFTLAAIPKPPVEAPKPPVEAPPPPVEAPKPPVEKPKGPITLDKVPDPPKDRGGNPRVPVLGRDTQGRASDGDGKTRVQTLGN
ncbi:MAG: serine/threonine-protein kinase [bacterium]|nr:serine/threonine protein kinase [Myxococcales bacterium]MCB9542653.1 serine/threonine protein kinase [Myxococcales bacterium]MCB9550968.1 serine/threonine protein kinase [Myxococcales bacterium]